MSPLCYAIDLNAGNIVKFNHLQTPSLRLWIGLVPAIVALIAAILWAVQPNGAGFFALSRWQPSLVHPGVWVALGVGFIAYLISAWLWALKPKNLSTRLFALSGIMTLLFSFAAAFSLMSVALPEPLSSLRPMTNMFGASGFGIVMICFFTIYPSKLRYWQWICSACILVFGLLTLLSAFGPFKDFGRVQPITLVEMVCIILSAFWQIWAVRHDPVKRAVAVWLGVTVFFGAGAFIVLISVPYSFGFEPLILPHYAFSSFLLIYIGLAIGLLRYKLFELGTWSFHLIFHVCFALVFVLIDTVLISLFSLNRGLSLSFLFGLMVFFYLPLRDFFWKKLTQVSYIKEVDLFRRVVDVALKPNRELRALEWEKLVQNLFNPLEIKPTSHNFDTPLIKADGLELYLPALAHASALNLYYPHQGHKLFSPHDLEVAEQVVSLMHFAEESRGAYDRGVTVERTRIARDIHDNIGAQLLKALHSSSEERKDAMIRDTLADLREIINNAQSETLDVSLFFADLRAETADRLSPHSIDLEWTSTYLELANLTSLQLLTLKALIREATSNIIKHAKASLLSVKIKIENDHLFLDFSDNGEGFTKGRKNEGHGLKNMRSRIESLGGQFSVSSSTLGTIIGVSLPLSYEKEGM